MALRPKPKSNIDLQKLDDLQKEIFGSKSEEVPTVSESKNEDELLKQKASQAQPQKAASGAKTQAGKKAANSAKAEAREDKSAVRTISAEALPDSAGANANLDAMESIALGIVSSKAGQGRSTTRPFSIPRTLIIDTTRLKAKFRTIDEQFTQNVIVDFLLREALSAATPENYREMRAEAFKFVKRAEETTRRSLTVTEEVIYQMSELKAGINLETGKKYSNDEIFSTLLAIGVSRLYQNGVLN